MNIGDALENSFKLINTQVGRDKVKALLLKSTYRCAELSNISLSFSFQFCRAKDQDLLNLQIDSLN